MKRFSFGDLWCYSHQVVIYFQKPGAGGPSGQTVTIKSIKGKEGDIKLKSNQPFSTPDSLLLPGGISPATPGGN